MGRTLQSGLRVVEKLGSTHEGPLYRAEYPNGIEVALVILGPAPDAHESSVDSGTLAYLQQRFLQAAQIRHLNVAAVHEIGEIPDGPAYAVLDWLAGEPLSEILAERGVLPLDEAVDLCLQAAAGLEAAHEVGLVHANLSPDAVLVTQTADGLPLVKLVGFALVSSRQPDPGGPIDREVNFEYASPERLAGHIPDERSDVFSLGAVLHHMLVGVPPGFGSEESSVPEAIRAAMAEALAPAPDQRFQTISEFAAAVERAAAIATGPKRAGIRRALLLAAAGVAPVAAALWLFWSLQGRGPGADGRAQEGGITTPASGVPAEGTETGSAALASGGGERREISIAPPATLPAPTRSQASREAPQAGSSLGGSAPAVAQDRIETKSPAAKNPAKVRQEKLGSLRAAAAAATAKLDEERRRARAEAVTRAFNGDQATQPSSVSEVGTPGAGDAPDTSAMSTPSPVPASPPLEERAQVYLRIGLDEASQRLGGPAHAIEGMSPLFMGLAQGRFPEGADTTVPLVRAVYLDPNGGLILLDQQRIWPEQSAPATTPTRRRLGDIMLYLHGEARPERLRSLAGRVR